jgi:hypothetical protein
MKRQYREDLEQGVQSLERENPKWSASKIEQALSDRLPLAYGEWKQETANLRSRLRAVQRWRIGARGRDAGRGQRHLFPYVWPVGERQRKEVEPEFHVSGAVVSGSWRLYLYNCSPEVVRDVRVFLDGQEVDYAPSVMVDRFVELHWQRVDKIKSEALAGSSGDPTQHRLLVDFVVARGTRQARVEGDLHLDPTQGWVFFHSRDGRHRELE